MTGVAITHALGKLFKQLFLCLAQIYRGFNHRSAHQVANTATAHGLNTLTAQPEQLTGLRLSRNFEFDTTIQCGHIKFAAQRCIGKRNRNFAV